MWFSFPPQHDKYGYRVGYDWSVGLCSMFVWFTSFSWEHEQNQIHSVEVFFQMTSYDRHFGDTWLLWHQRTVEVLLSALGYYAHYMIAMFSAYYKVIQVIQKNNRIITFNTNFTDPVIWILKREHGKTMCIHHQKYIISDHCQHY